MCHGAQQAAYIFKVVIFVKEKFSAEGFVPLLYINTYPGE
jgi:hypothetical protein